MNMHAAPRDKLVARFFFLFILFSIRNSDHIYFAFPKSLSRQLEFEAVFTSKLSQAALTHKKRENNFFFFHLNSFKIFVVISFNSYFIPDSDKQMEKKNTSVKD